MSDNNKTGHRERLRNRFIAGEDDAHSDERLLELLLSYAVPRRDVRQTAERLIEQVGSIEALLRLSYEDLCGLDGVGPNSAVLFRLVDFISQQVTLGAEPHEAAALRAGQLTLLIDEEQSPAEGTVDYEVQAAETEAVESVAEAVPDEPEHEPEARPCPSSRRPGTGLFGMSILDEAINQLPHLPDADALDEVREFLIPRLPYSSQQTRHRNASYIIRRMFPGDFVDRPMREFAKTFAEQPELRDVCFYRFCKAEPLMYEVVDSVLLPAIGHGKLPRSAIKDHLDPQFPDSKSTGHCATAIVSSLTAGGIADANHNRVSFGYRELLIPSFAFILHSEFPGPGMYDIGLLAKNPAIRAMLWYPDRIVPALYELRNQGIISKVSEIDTVRQFSTKWTLAELVDHLVSGEQSE